MTTANSEFPVQTRLVAALLTPMQLSLHGMPERDRTEHLEHWRGHLSLLHADRGSIRVVNEFVRSTAVHLAWRVTFGPPSAFLPGAAILLAGVAMAVLAFSAVDLIANTVASTAALFLGAILVRHPRVQPRGVLAIATLLSAVVCALYSIAIASDIWSPTDWFIVAGTGLMSIGMTLVGLGASPLELVELQVGRAWGFGIGAFGAGSIAVAELDWLRQGGGTSMLIGRGLTAVAVLAMAFTMWRIREVPQDPTAPFRIEAVGVDPESLSGLRAN